MTLPLISVTPQGAPPSNPRNGPLTPFHVASVAFQRARQLKNGARPRVDSASRSPTRLALLEVLADTVPWTVEALPPPNGGSAARLPL
jgi:DNA-directed RNA polymerase subunit K/omega